jgi:hypothetical protein
MNRRPWGDVASGNGPSPEVHDGPPASADGKRTYRPPQLLQYGSLTQFTGSTMMGGTLDCLGKGKSGGCS